jgi:hypothetical protein
MILLKLKTEVYFTILTLPWDKVGLQCTLKKIIPNLWVFTKGIGRKII